MEGEIFRFRRKFLGGFNRDDVTAYIAKLTQERNESLDAAEELRRGNFELRGEITRLQKELGKYHKLVENLRNQQYHQKQKPVIIIKMKKGFKETLKEMER